MPVGMPQPDQTLKAVEQVLAPIPKGDLLPLLAYLEQRAKQGGDLATLRALRTYRANLNL